ncbi:hypothetical protein ACFQX6_29435 [Streptosporangium lutulentum]
MTDAKDGTRAGTLQLAAVAVVILGVLPYLLLKITWLAAAAWGSRTRP